LFPFHCFKKKLRCCRETARYLVSLNISLSHSRTLSETSTIRKLGYGFLFVFRGNYMALSCIVSEIKRDIDPKFRVFHTRCIDVSVGRSSSEKTKKTKKTRIVQLPTVKKVLFSRFNGILACDRQNRRTDGRQTNRQTDILQQHSPRTPRRKQCKQKI